MTDKLKATTRLLAAAITGQDAEPTTEQIEATKEMLSRDSVVRRILPPVPVQDDDPFLKACQEITGDRPLVRPVFPPAAAAPLIGMDFASIEIDMQRRRMFGFDKRCRVCHALLTGTGYRNTDNGPVHVACLEPKKPAEPYVPPEIEG